MKICFFTSQFFPGIGGAEFMVHNLAVELVNKGHQVSVLAPVKPSPSIALPYPVHTMKNLSGLVYRLADKWDKTRLELSWNLTLEKIRLDFDILHVHFAYPLGYAAGLWGQEHGVPTLLTCHGIDIMWLPQWRFGIRPPETEIFTKIFQTVNRVVAVSQNLESEIARLGCPQEKLSTIPNGVNTQELAPRPTTPDNPAILLAMGRQEMIKGFDILLDVFNTVVSQKKNVRLYLAGQGPEFYHLLEASLRLGLKDRVVFHKTVVGDKKRSLLENCSLFICPSRWEGMPLVVLEAFAAGKTVVAFGVGGIGEIIKNNQNGILIPAFDTALMAEKIIELLDNPIKKAQLGTEARRTALKYNWSHIADQYLELYKGITSQDYI